MTNITTRKTFEATASYSLVLIATECLAQARKLREQEYHPAIINNVLTDIKHTCDITSEILTSILETEGVSKTSLV